MVLPPCGWVGHLCFRGTGRNSRRDRHVPRRARGHQALWQKGREERGLFQAICAWVGLERSALRHRGRRWLLAVRTGGERRISNFLLWQCAYSEFFFCDALWPDFSGQEMQKSLDEYASRQRRYGKTGDQIEDFK